MPCKTARGEGLHLTKVTVRGEGNMGIRSQGIPTRYTGQDDRKKTRETELVS